MLGCSSSAEDGFGIITLNQLAPSILPWAGVDQAITHASLSLTFLEHRSPMHSQKVNFKAKKHKMQIKSSRQLRHP